MVGSTGVATRKRRSPEQRRGEIIHAAVALFARQGFERTTTKEIAAAAGIAEGTIYKYFASKQDILFSFITPEAVSDMLDLFLVRDGIDDALVIREFLRNRFALWERHRDLMRVVFSEAMHNPTLAEGLQRMILPAIETGERFVAHRIADGAFREMDERVAIRAVVGAALAYFLMWELLMPKAAPAIEREKLLDELTAFFLNGVKR
ncbi:MAG TPA: TetR/AcrR family transcriptional regulator [Armatimonadota bacterium]|jgi:AcrR family transcriptional regulator